MIGRSLVVVSFLAVLVAGCGQGGSDGATPAAAPATTAAVAQSGTTAATAPGASVPEPATTTPGDELLPNTPELDGSKLPKGVPGDLPDGTYRLTVVHDDIATLDLPEDLADTVIAENVGVYTWKLAAGRWHMEQTTTPPPAIPSLDGTYIVNGDQVTFYFPSGIPMNLDEALSEEVPPAAVEKFRWTVDGGVVRLAPLDGTDPLAVGTMASHPWQPVADAASV